MVVYRLRSLKCEQKYDLDFYDQSCKKDKRQFFKETLFTNYNQKFALRA